MQASDELYARMHAGLKQLGYDSFRSTQEKAVAAALTGRDTLVLMPTGGGKSLCFALPAAIMGKLVVVVSPLIALMQDQARSFQSRGIQAEYLSSSQTSSEQEAILKRLQASRLGLQLLLTTPESFGTDRLLAILRMVYAKGALGLIAVDEAHCISSWGHDFRPAYRRLARLRQEFARTPLMALTATATKEVQEDILSSLKLNHPLRLISSFNRPNITYEVAYQLESSPPLAKQLSKLIQGMAEPDGTTPCCIVYTLKRETADEYAQKLRCQGVDARAYHAGLKDAVRGKVLEDWSAGAVPVVVATIAFGMGIDRANVRLVVHLNLPKSLEGFYQESGRAGRDGLPAKSVLFYDIEDRQRMEYILSKQGGKKRKASSLTGKDNSPEKASVSFNKVVSYSTEERCRRATLLKHFGERLSSACRGCDYCLEPQKVSKQLAQLSLQGPKRMAEQMQKYGARSQLSFGRQPDGDASESSEDMIEEADDGKEEAKAALRAAKKARSNGSPSDTAMLNAMEAAEKQHESRKAHSSRGARLLQKMEGSAAPSSSAKPGFMSISEGMRVASRARLAQAMQDSPACTHEPSIQQAAEAVEAACFSSSASKSVYISKLAQHVRSAATPEGLQAVLCCAGAGPGSAGPGNVRHLQSQHPAAARPGTQILPTCANGTSRYAELSRGDAGVAEQVDSLVGSLRSWYTKLRLPTPQGTDSCDHACKALQHMEVNSAILKATGAGKTLRHLVKGSLSEERKAVGCQIKQVIECWKLKVAAE